MEEELKEDNYGVMVDPAGRRTPKIANIVNTERKDKNDNKSKLANVTNQNNIKTLNK